MIKLNFMHFLVLMGVALSILSGCVSQNQHQRLLDEKESLDAAMAICDEDLTIAKARIERLILQVQEMAEDSTVQGKQLREKLDQLATLQEKHDRIEAYYNNLLSNSGKLSGELEGQRQRLLEMEENLQDTQQQNEELSENLKEREKKVEELEQVLADKEQAVNELKNKVSQALLNFKDNDLTIEVKNGKVYVSLAEQLLFGSGSINVDSKGVGALQQLAKVLKEQDDINILVEGHTDNVPVSNSSPYMNDNWDLSVLRATSIVNILTKAGVDPERITAAGKGEHNPLTANDSAEGKQTNRRTEIILTPQLDELFQLLEAN